MYEYEDLKTYILQMVRIARELGYPKEVRLMIKNADSKEEVDRLMTSARKRFL